MHLKLTTFNTTFRKELQKANTFLLSYYHLLCYTELDRHRYIAIQFKEIIGLKKKKLGPRYWAWINIIGLGLASWS